MIRIDDDERRARLARNHHLAGAPEPTVVDLARALVGLHATDPASVYLACQARIPTFTVASLEHALYDVRTLDKHLGMRRTVFVTPPDLTAVMHAACTIGVSRTIRTRLVKDLVAGGVGDDGDAFLREAEDATLAALSDVGEAAGQELSRAVPILRTTLSYAPDKAYGGDIGIATRVLTQLAADRRIRRGRPRGSWTSSQHRWQLAPPMPADLPEANAQSELIRRYVESYGPVTVADVAWWTGLGLTRARTALAAVDAVEVQVASGPAYVLADDAAAPLPPRAALLPALDSTVMGFKERAFYLGAHADALFDRNGNAGPTIWWDGRIVGGWSQRRDGQVVTGLLERVAPDGLAAIAAEVARLQTWLNGTIVTLRFPTPLFRSLRDGGDHE